MSGSKNIYGNDFIFTRNEKDSYINIKAGKDEKLRLHGTIDIVDYDGMDGEITINGNPLNSTLYLEQLADVNVSTGLRFDGELLTYDAGAGEWVNSVHNLSDDADVNINTPTDGQLLWYTAGKWRNITPPAWITANQPMWINDLQDVNTDVVYQAGIISYTQNEWKSVPLYLNYNQDCMVATSGITEGSVFVFTNGYWRPSTVSWITGTPAIPVSLDDLSDVVISAITSGNILVYTSGYFKNVPFNYALNDLNDVAISTVTNGDIIVYTNGGFINVNKSNLFEPTYDVVPFMSWTTFFTFGSGDYEYNIYNLYYSSVVGKYVANDYDPNLAFTDELYNDWTTITAPAFLNSMIPTGAYYKDLNDKLFVIGYNNIAGKHKISYTTDTNLTNWSTCFVGTGGFYGMTYVSPTSLYAFSSTRSIHYTQDLVNFTHIPVFTRYGTPYDIKYSSYHNAVYIFATSTASNFLIRYNNDFSGSPTTYIGVGTGYFGAFEINESNGVIISKQLVNVGGNTLFYLRSDGVSNFTTHTYPSVSLHSIIYDEYEGVFRGFPDNNVLENVYNMTEWISKDGITWKSSNVKPIPYVSSTLNRSDGYIMKRGRDLEFRLYVDIGDFFYYVRGKTNSGTNVGYISGINTNTGDSVSRPLNFAYAMDDISFTSNERFVRFNPYTLKWYNDRNPYVSELAGNTISSITNTYLKNIGSNIWVNTTIANDEIYINWSTYSTLFTGTGANFNPNIDVYVNRIVIWNPDSYLSTSSTGANFQRIQLFDNNNLPMIEPMTSAKVQTDNTASLLGVDNWSTASFTGVSLSRRIFAPLNWTTTFSAPYNGYTFTKDPVYDVSIWVPQGEVKNPSYVDIRWATATISPNWVAQASGYYVQLVSAGYDIPLAVSTIPISGGGVSSANGLSFITMAVNTNFNYNITMNPEYIKFSSSNQYISTTTELIAPMYEMIIDGSDTIAPSTVISSNNIYEMRMYDFKDNLVSFNDGIIVATQKYTGDFTFMNDKNNTTKNNFCSSNQPNIYNDTMRFLSVGTGYFFIKKVVLSQTISTNTNCFVLYNGKMMKQDPNDLSIFTVENKECTIFNVPFDGYYRFNHRISANNNNIAYFLINYSNDIYGEYYKRIGTSYFTNNEYNTDTELRQGTKIAFLLAGLSTGTLLKDSASNKLNIYYRPYQTSPQSQFYTENNIKISGKQLEWTTADMSYRTFKTDGVGANMLHLPLLENNKSYIFKVNGGTDYAYNPDAYSDIQWTTYANLLAGVASCKVPNRKIVLYPFINGLGGMAKIEYEAVENNFWTTVPIPTTQAFYPSYMSSIYSKRTDNYLGFTSISAGSSIINYSRNFNNFYVNTVGIGAGHSCIGIVENDTYSVIGLATGVVLVSSSLDFSLTWTSAYVATGLSLTSMFYYPDNKTFYAVNATTGYSSLYTSTNAITWTSQFVSPSNLRFKSIYYNDKYKYFRVRGTVNPATGVYVSRDLKTFSFVNVSNTNTSGIGSDYDYVNDIDVINGDATPLLSYPIEKEDINIGNKRSVVNINAGYVNIGQGSNILNLGDSNTSSIRIGKKIWGNTYFLQGAYWNDLASTTSTDTIPIYINIKTTTNVNFVGIQPLWTTNETIARNCNASVICVGTGHSNTGRLYINSEDAEGLYQFSALHIGLQGTNTLQAIKSNGEAQNLSYNVSTSTGECFTFVYNFYMVKGTWIQFNFTRRNLTTHGNKSWMSIARISN